MIARYARHIAADSGADGLIYIQDTVDDALKSVCVATGGTRCRHIDPHGRILSDGENCPLLTDRERAAIAECVWD